MAIPTLLTVSCSNSAEKKFIKVVEEFKNPQTSEIISGKNVMIKKSSISAYERVDRSNKLEGYSWFDNGNTWRIETEKGLRSYIYNDALIKLNEYVESADASKPIFNLNNSNEISPSYSYESNPDFNPVIENERSNISFLQALNRKNWTIQNRNFNGVDLYAKISSNNKIAMSESLTGTHNAPIFMFLLKCH